jgi:hypothetical protein
MTRLVKVYPKSEEALLHVELEKLFIFQGCRGSGIKFFIETFAREILTWGYEMTDILLGVKRLFDRDIGSVKLHSIKQSIADVVISKQPQQSEDYRNWKREPMPEKAKELINLMKIKRLKQEKVKIERANYVKTKKERV